MADIQSYLSVLNAEQKEAVEHEGSPLLILAGAGSGKTRVITTKIAYLIGEKGIPAWNILAVTFTKKAAKEMSERAVKLDERAKDAQIRTFHSFGSWFLRRYSLEAGLDQNFTVYDEDDMLTLLLKAVPSLTRQAAGKAVHKISLAKDFCLTPDSKELYTIEADPDFPEIYEAYEKRLHSTGNVDFGDLIMLPVKILQQNEKIRAQMQYRFRVIMVDEYQDSNVAQFKLLQELSGLNEGSGTYVCVVGDDDQSIYRFRGAEVQNILNFQQYFPGTKLIRLERNYRSTAQILHAADCVVSKNESRLGKTLIAERGEGSKPVLAFIPPPEPESWNKDKEKKDPEAQFCADLIQDAHRQGCPYSDWAILYRMNAQSLGFESEFLRRKIPYTVVGSLKFYQREEIKDILAFLALIANPRDEIAFRRIINKPAHGIGEKTQDAVVDFAKQSLAGSLVNAARTCSKTASKKAGAALLEFADLMEGFTERIGIDIIEETERSGISDEAAVNSQNIAADSTAAVQNDQNAPSDENTIRLSDFIDEVAEKSGLFEYHKSQDEISGTQKVANIQELENNALFYPCSRKGLLDFLDSIELDRSLEESSGNEADSVTLITLHNTKGLEFPRVIITGLETGIFPRQDKTGSDLEEERRLFYVGITRAKNQLYITSCSVRRLYGKTEFMQPSQFLIDAGKDSFTIIGKIPPAFARAIQNNAGRSSIDNEIDEDLSDDFSDGYSTENTALSKKWKKGVRVFHDDYGYGQIIEGAFRGEEYVITVIFENGGKKSFIPKYQSNNLMIAND